MARLFMTANSLAGGKKWLSSCRLRKFIWAADEADRHRGWSEGGVDRGLCIRWF
jgi:hypothetical protein